MKQRYPHLLTALVALVTLATATTAVAPARVMAAEGDAKRDPLTLAQEQLQAIQDQANLLTGWIADAQTQQAQLESQIAESERTIPELRAHAESLRLVVKQRAVQLYVDHGQRLDQVLAADDVVAGARAAQLTGSIAKHDTDVAAELRATAQQLVAQEEQLRTQREALQQTVDRLAPLEELLQKRLVAASATYDKVKSAHDLQRMFGSVSDIPTGASRCPVDGFVVFTDDFGQPRSGGTTHQGIDMPAASGTPVVAVVDGIMRHDVGGAGGNGAWLTGVDGVSYYYAHFSRYEGDDRIVRVGDVIGYVGMTGVATGPHLHFEVHPGAPGQNPAIDGYTLLLSICGDEMARPRAVSSPASPGGATG